MTVEPVCLEAGDAVELCELLGFLGQWLASDRPGLGDSLQRFVGSGAYDVEALQAGVLRFEFLLGGSAESLFRGDEP